MELAGESGDGDGNGAQRVASADLGDDTFSDGSEVALGTDPNDPGSFSRQPIHSLAPGGLLLLGIASGRTLHYSHSRYGCITSAKYALCRWTGNSPQDDSRCSHDLVSLVTAYRQKHPGQAFGMRDVIQWPSNIFLSRL